jgi:hypothetical protein
MAVTATLQSDAVGATTTGGGDVVFLKEYVTYCST